MVGSAKIIGFVLKQPRSGGRPESGCGTGLRFGLGGGADADRDQEFCQIVVAEFPVVADRSVVLVPVGLI